jgi:hypothetical protein
MITAIKRKIKSSERPDQLKRLLVMSAALVVKIPNYLKK